MIHTTLLNIVVTVMLSGHPTITERLLKEYAATDGGKACHAAADALNARKITKKGVRIFVECDPALTRGA